MNRSTVLKTRSKHVNCRGARANTHLLVAVKKKASEGYGKMNGNCPGHSERFLNEGKNSVAELLFTHNNYAT
uniref:Uncharacterized protein n=1 Tax=Arundo donax TaxID=35708 RepID=A0A0A9CJS0_ARUDO